MLSEIAHIILELGGCQGWALTSTPPPMCSRNPNQNFVSILLVQFVIPVVSIGSFFKLLVAEKKLKKNKKVFRMGQLP